MISALCWLPRGAASALEESPDVQPEPAELAQQAEDQRSTDSEEESDEENEGQAVARARAAASALRAGTDANPAVQSMDSQMAELRMDQYDDEEETGQTLFGGGNPGMTYYKSNHEDPYITVNGQADKAADSEAEDDELRESDFVILSARNEDDVSHLEVWVYEDADEDDGNLYVHHDILLPEFPLCLAWMDCPPSSSGRDSGNLAAVGSMGPGIEIWNLNVVDTVEPLACLGGLDASAPVEAAADASTEDNQKKTKKKKKKRKPTLREGSHTDAVLGLDWNAAFRNVLASGSADKQVKVWDVAALQCTSTLTHHTGKVQAVAWNPAEAPVLLSGGFDHQLHLTDVRGAQEQGLTWEMQADLEAIDWSPSNPTSFVASAEDGMLAAFDARAGSKSEPLYRLSAHSKATSAVSFCSAVSGLLCTASTDGTVKLWDVASNQPSLIATATDMAVGAIFTCSFCKEAPWLIAAGGANGTVAVWDITTSAAVQGKYGQQLAANRQTVAANKTEAMA